MAEVLGIISSVIALGQAVDGLGMGMRFIASMQGAPDAFLDLQNELSTVLGYLLQIREVLDGFSTSSSGSGAPVPPGVDYVRGVADNLDDEVKDLTALELDFKAEAQGKTDAKGRPKVPKIRWARHLTTINELRGRVKRRKQDLAHALSVLQAKQIGQQEAMLVDITKVVTTGFQQVERSTKRSEAAVINTLMSELTQSGGAVMSTLRENTAQGNILLRRADELKDIISKLEHIVRQDVEDQTTDSGVKSEFHTLHARLGDLAQTLECRDNNLGRDITSMHSTLHDISERMKHGNLSIKNLEQQLGALVLSSESQGSATLGRGQSSHNIQGPSCNRPISIQTTLHTSRRCDVTCNCQCHKTSAIGSPHMLSGILGKLLIAYNSIPSWRARTCDHPKCRRHSPGRFNLTYMFPRWMLRRGLAFYLSWDSVTGVGADIYLAIPRVVADDAWVWRAINTSNIAWLQKRMARKEVFPTEVGENGESLLMYAIAVGSYEAASFLLGLQPKASLAWQTSSGLTLGALIWQELRKSDESMFAIQVIQEIYSLTEDHVSSTPIIDAVLGTSGMSLQTALDSYYDYLNIHDSGGYTALHWATYREDIDAVRLLLAYKADPCARTRDTCQETCLHIAGRYANASLVEELLAAGSDIEAVAFQGRTALMDAVTFGDKQVVEALLTAGASALAVDYQGRSAFHRAAFTRNDSEEEIFAILGALIECGGDINGLDQSGDAAIHTAVVMDNVATFRALCGVGAKVDQVGYGGRTVLHYAAWWARFEMITAFTELEIHTIDPELMNDRGYTATDIFEDRIKIAEDMLPVETRPTKEEIPVFRQLVSDMRERYQANIQILTDKDESEQGKLDEDELDEDESNDDESDDNWESCEE